MERRRGKAIKIILAVWRCQKDRQGADRHTHTCCQIQTKRRGRRIHGPTIKKYKRADRQRGGGRRERRKDTGGHEERQPHTHNHKHKGLVRRLKSAGGLCCIHLFKIQECLLSRAPVSSVILRVSQKQRSRDEG